MRMDARQKTVADGIAGGCKIDRKITFALPEPFLQNCRKTFFPILISKVEKLGIYV